MSRARGFPSWTRPGSMSSGSSRGCRAERGVGSLRVRGRRRGQHLCRGGRARSRRRAGAPAGAHRRVGAPGDLVAAGGCLPREPGEPGASPQVRLPRGRATRAARSSRQRLAGCDPARAAEHHGGHLTEGLSMSVLGRCMGIGLVLTLAATPAAESQTKREPAAGRKEFKVTWLGHAAFEVVSSGGTRLLIDPFVSKNPATPEAFKDPARYKPDAILVSHAHSDHSGDALEIAKASG